MLVVLGSVNADLLFKVRKLPAPGETVLCPSYETAPGGKGSNQAAAAVKAARSKASVRFVGHVGDDANGPVVRKFLQDAGLNTDSLATSPKPTAVAVIGVDEAGENAIIVASGANLDTRSDQVPDDWLGQGTTVLCQNEIRLAETEAFLRRAKNAGCRTVLNLAPAGKVSPDTLGALDVLIVNELEARELAGDEAAPLEDLAKSLASGHGLVCVVTLGGKGAIAFESGGAEHRVPPLEITPHDTTGAGDAFSGVLALALDEGRPLPEALRWAAVAGGLACEKVGAQTAQPDRKEIETRL